MTDAQQPPANASEQPPVSAAERSFLEKVMLKAQLEDIYDARDLSEVVFRTMRDLMTTEAADRVASELQSPAQPGAARKSLQNEISELWKDTNPLVSLLSRLRPPLDFDDETFLFRIRQEGGLQRGIDPQLAVKAVFGAVKDELSGDRIAEIGKALPGSISQLWQQS